MKMSIMMSTIFMMKSLPKMIMLLSLITIYMMSMSSMINMMSMNIFMFMDYISWLMIMLTLISIMLIMISSYNLKNISYTMIPILIILIITFLMSNMINFYIMFELVLIPTMILIMMMGKQPERLQASIYLMMYTITASLPLLAMIIYMKNPTFYMSFIVMINNKMVMFLMLAFLAKMPMYFMHLWLPKAHVEAPLEGSMILAAVLLKLGGYGLIRFIPICIKKMNTMNYWIISISMMGATATSLNCIRQKDLKSLIAYSSVAHMGFVLTGIFSMNYIGLTGAIIMMIAHGLSSSALFLLVNDLYSKYLTRNISLFKGMISMTPNITFWWFMFMSINISAPPTINTISEIFLMSSIIKWNNLSMLLIFMMSIMTASFSMMMFVNITHNKNFMKHSNQTQHKLFLSLFMHMIPLILMILKMNTMYMYMY